MSMDERTCSGVLELNPKGYGFLRDPARNFKASGTDVYVGSPFLARFSLRQGVRLTGVFESRGGGEGPRLAELTEIEGRKPAEYLGLNSFDERLRSIPTSGFAWKPTPRRWKCGSWTCSPRSARASAA